MKILEAEHLCKSFGQTKVLKDISFSLEESQVLSIIGSSGSGKTTLLRCLNFLEQPDKGMIRVKDKTVFDAANPTTMQEAEIRKNRLHFGLVFQSFNLFPQYTALKNVMLAKELLAKERPDYKARKKEIHDEIEAQAVKVGEKSQSEPTFIQEIFTEAQEKALSFVDEISKKSTELAVALEEVKKRENQVIARDNDSRKESIRLQQWQNELNSKQADVDCKEQRNKEEAYSLHSTVGTAVLHVFRP